MNSKSISFVFTGAVAALTYTKEGKRSCGFIDCGAGETREMTQWELRNELIALGYKPEFIGRIPHLVLLDRLTKEDRMRLAEKELYPELTEMLKATGRRISIDDECKRILAEEMDQGLGFREMQSVAMQMYYMSLDEPKANTGEDYVVTGDQLERLLGHKARW